MKRVVVFLAILLTAYSAFSQTAITVTFIVKNKDTKESIADASVRVKDSESGAVTDKNGRADLTIAASPVTSKGFETNTRLGNSIAKLFLGYTFTDVRAGYLAGDRRLTLLPKHRINSSLVFEKESDFKTGVEFYYGSSQTLSDRSRTHSLGEFGLFGEKTFGKYSLFINAENLTDIRQSRYGQVVGPPHQNPSFAELYTHTEGRIINGGIKIRL